MNGINKINYLIEMVANHAARQHKRMVKACTYFFVIYASFLAVLLISTPTWILNSIGVFWVMSVAIVPLTIILFIGVSIQWLTKAKSMPNIKMKNTVSTMALNESDRLMSKKYDLSFEDFDFEKFKNANFLSRVKLLGSIKSLYDIIDLQGTIENKEMLMDGVRSLLKFYTPANIVFIIISIVAMILISLFSIVSMLLMMVF